MEFPFVGDTGSGATRLRSNRTDRGCASQWHRIEAHIFMAYASSGPVHFEKA
jgi:hypothetical protein